MRIKNILFLLLLSCSSGIVTGQITLTSGNGYLDQPAGMKSTIVRKEAVTVTGQMAELTPSEKTEVYSYMDGFGRPITQVTRAASPNGKDIIRFTKYPAPGATQKDYLPYEGANGNGAYVDPSTAVTNQATFYTANTYSGKVAQDNYPFAETVFEASPMQRVLSQGGVGNGFQLTQNYKSFVYRSNNSSSEIVRKWTAAGVSTSTWATGDLMVSEGTDEEGTKTRIYTDKFGRTILKRQDGPSSTVLDTYYIYDGAGNIVYLIPPLGVQKMVTAGYNVSNCPNLIFSFVYDFRHRLVEKKVPGQAAPVFLVYDPLDRLVLMQDANMRTPGTKWHYMKYDALGRVVVQGVYTHGGSALSRTDMQNHVNIQACYNPSGTTYYEQKTHLTSSYYTDVCFPVNGSGNSTEERQYNYYDDYNFDSDAFLTPDYSYTAQGLTGETAATNILQGLPTGQKRKIMDVTGNWLVSVSFYDRYYNVLQVKTNNQLNTSVNDVATTVTDFTGKPTIAKTYKHTGSVTLTVQTRYIYDAGGRLIEVKQSNQSGTEYTVSKNEYNALGQVIDKKLHSTNGVNFLQSVDYRYNIRGQLLSINNSARNVNAANNDETNDVFGMELLYENVDANVGNTANYTGMISAVKWSGITPVSSTPDEKAFLYSYDKAGRLTSAVYKGRVNGGSGTFNKEVNGYNETFTYDANGNIASLLRNAWMSGSATQIDNLTYTYTGSGDNNRLSNISDAQSTNATGWGFRNFTGSGSGYTYDDNGNLLTDAKKGTTITYSDLDKPVKIQKTTSKKVEYIYDASGIRLTSLIYANSLSVTKRIDYVGGIVIENSTTLAYYGMSEGRIRNNSGTLKPEYFITDHQGNTRSTFEDNGSGVALVRQLTDYYAFGMQMAGGYNTTAPNKQLYNAGSEWQDYVEEGLADYYSTFFREYDPVIGRFNGVDPKAEMTESWSTYHYSYNNPVMFSDPMGDYARLNLQEIVNRINNVSKGHGGRWSSTDGIPYAFNSPEEALGWGIGIMESHNLWGGGGTFASSAQHAMYRYSLIKNYGTGELTNQIQKHIYINNGFTASFTTDKFLGYTQYDYGIIEEKYYYAGFHNPNDEAAIRAGYELHQNYWSGVLSTIQTGADILGSTEIPILSQIGDISSGLISVGQGDYTGAAMSLGGAFFPGLSQAKMIRNAANVGMKAAKTGMTDLQLVTRAAQKAETAIGGTGRFAGTAKHTYANNLLSRYQSIYGNRGLQFNQYFNGPAGRGFLDVVNHRTMTIYDYKFGSAVMGNSQFLKYSNSFPGYGIQIIRP